MNINHEIIHRLNLVIKDLEMLMDEKWELNGEGIDASLSNLHIIKILVAKLQEKPINKVTTQLLNLALRMVGLYFEENVTDNVIDLMELLEDKGGKTTMKDIIELQTKWRWKDK